MTSTGNRVAWVLGAGFSKSLGGPLLVDMFSKRTQEESRHRFKSLDPTSHNELYEFYRKHQRPERGHVLWGDAEEFLDYADTAREDGHRQKVLKELGQDVVRLHTQCIASLAAETSFASGVSLSSEAWQPYLTWARTLTRNDSIITFNYDLVLERLGEDQTVRNLGPETVFDIEESAVPGSAAIIYKLHGSVDWLVPMDGSKKILRAAEPQKMLESPARILIASPGPAKRLRRDEVLNRIWDQAKLDLKAADTIVFLGYRFPPSDSMARSELFEAIKAKTGGHLKIHIVLGPNTSHPDNVRLASMLDVILKDAGRERTHTRNGSVNASYNIVQQPLYVEDFFTVLNPTFLQY